MKAQIGRGVVRPRVPRAPAFGRARCSIGAGREHRRHCAAHSFAVLCRGASSGGVHALLVLPAPNSGPAAGLVPQLALSAARRNRAPQSAGRMGRSRAARHARGGARQHRRLPLPGAPRAPHRHRGLDRGAAGFSGDDREPGWRRRMCRAEDGCRLSSTKVKHLRRD